MASLNIAGVRKPAAKGHGGAHVAHHKNTSAMPVERMPVPASVTIPLSQHIGAPNEAQVKVGDVVKVGQVIGSTDAFVSAPVHATISGTVKAIKPVRIVNGNMVNAVVIESDGEMALSEDVKTPVIESKQDFLNAVRASGLVGLGGAGFPTHVKLAFKEDAGVDTLIINAAECEPYITVDHREMLDHPQDILSGVKEVVKWLGFKNAYIGIEDNKPDAMQVLLKTMEENEEFKDVLQIIALPSTYPQGAEKVLIYSATGRQV
ncbi:MAG: RnfABCDGE type electron transport complex subunit C, partial [Clostridia bacterium]|nr:RnfABCDGE type electron transport complex subunit C [Clostridia bacterium]